MKKSMNVFLVFAFVVLLVYPTAVHAGRKGKLLKFFENKYVIKAYVPEIVNSSGVSKVDVRGLKEGIENALASRRSHKFEIVTDKAAADIVIDVDIAEYFWTEKDPVDMVFSPIAAAADAAKADNYARMQADISIKRGRDGRELWDDRVQSTITDDTMTEQESYSRSNKRLVEVFLKELFKKPKRR